MSENVPVYMPTEAEEKLLEALLNPANRFKTTKEVCDIDGCTTEDIPSTCSSILSLAFFIRQENFATQSGQARELGFTAPRGLTLLTESGYSPKRASK